MSETLGNSERLTYDEIYSRKVSNKQKAYQESFAVTPNTESGFFLPLEFYQDQIDDLVANLSGEGGEVGSKLLHYKNQPNQYVDGFEIDLGKRRFIIMRDSFFDDSEFGIKLVNAETIVLTILDESEWSKGGRGESAEKVYNYISNLISIGDMDDLTALALSLELGDKPKEFLGGQVFKPGHNAYWNILVKSALDARGLKSEQDLKIILSTMGMTTINTLPRLSQMDDPSVNSRTEIDSLKEAIKMYQGT